MTDAELHWRKSSHSAASSECVELARHPQGDVYVRNSNHPAAGTLALTAAQAGDWIAACGAGDLDDLTG